MADENLPWLVFPPAVDLSNTVIATPAGPRDLLESEEELAGWIAAERDRIAGVEAASGRLAEVRELRASVRELLHARARGGPPPPGGAPAVESRGATWPVLPRPT